MDRHERPTTRRRRRRARRGVTAGYISRKYSAHRFRRRRSRNDLAENHSMLAPSSLVSSSENGFQLQMMTVMAPQPHTTRSVWLPDTPLTPFAQLQLSTGSNNPTNPNSQHLNVALPDEMSLLWPAIILTGVILIFPVNWVANACPARRTLSTRTGGYRTSISTLLTLPRARLFTPSDRLLHSLLPTPSARSRRALPPTMRPS